ncbi:ImmA/IrrE family metallo-endopeptidase [uncultured Bacteroides sp.]|uniref:ImmA/IrrE family metallo-endopeptidase n=1 Tax=uncultured Bacteroides sp. TaxID=162156 RepID=UPI002AABDA02|nr:ImmA/IrrE family metallo-endopeptidase [uncultured Bacteroides sp.]
MAKDNLLKRGFKAQAERLAEKYRTELEIHACGSLCAFALAKHLSIPIYPATDFLESETHIDLLKGENEMPSEWSALTMPTAKGNRIIIYNPYHSDARQQSDIMHEIAHIICKHKRSQLQYEFKIPIGMHEFDEVQEEEAKCLGATLQLARPCLLWARKKHMTTDQVATHFNASSEMVKYRKNMLRL